MSESTPSSVTGNSAEHAALTLTPEAIDAVLADFRGWLEQLGDAPVSLDGTAPPEPIDLHTLVGQFAALRHEVNLQTKATRTQQEQNADTLRQLTQAVEAAKQAPKTDTDDDEAVRPLLKTLVDAADALALAKQEIERLQTTTGGALERLTTESQPAPSGLARWFSRGTDNSSAARRQAAEQVRRLLDSVLTGYGMSVQRIERALQQHGLEAIACVGERFDPECMEVVEAVAESGRPSGEVIAEVRRGYLWNDRVFRCAQVRVAK
ncbi:MAG: nucleotide exchange factor GrpE [Gemmataceae bacterium]|nr:nucleotide exchange factor GrpE [Gemmataceae bacterium]